MIDTKSFAHPKPSKVKRQPQPGVIIRHGREICNLKSAAGLREYKRRIEVMRQEQGGRCAIGGEPLAAADATFDHEVPRGHGGGNRQDAIYDPVTGEPINAAVCFLHNSEKGSRRIEYKVKRFLAEER